MTQCKVENQSSVNLKIAKLEKTVEKSAETALKKGLVSYSEVVSRSMPPPKNGSKSRSIAARLYKREVFLIDQLYKKVKSAALKSVLVNRKINGFKYAVWVYFNRGKRKKLQFAKTEREAKTKYGRIKYRGLYKWLWGAKISAMGEVVPTMFSRLLAKSPDLAKVSDLTKIKVEKKQAETAIMQSLEADRINNLAGKAKYDAKKTMLKKMKKILQSKVSDEIKKENEKC